MDAVLYQHGGLDVVLYQLLGAATQRKRRGPDWDLVRGACFNRRPRR
jgi:hypothetical protein